MARALRTARPGPARGEGAQAIEKRVKIHCWVGVARHVLFQACREGSEKHCWGGGGVGGAGSQWGVDRFIYVFCLSSNRHPKVAQYPHIRGLALRLGGVVFQRLYQNPHHI